MCFVIASLGALGIAACGESYSWHQKMTVEVITQDGVKAAFSTIAVSARTGGDFFTEISRGGVRIRGEAVALEVSPGKYIFAIFNDDYTESLAFRIFGRGGIREMGPILERMDGESRQLPKNEYPMLVAFEDTDEPASVYEINPDSLSSHFGPDVRIKSISLEITRDPITRGKILSILKWLPYVSKNRSTLIPDPPQFYDESLKIRYVHPRDFIVE